MNKDEYSQFVKKTESLVRPEDITTISFLGDFNKYLPRNTQHKIMEKGSKKVPYMGFIVDPYCLFLAYEIKDTERAQSMLPPDYELVESSLFADGVKKPLVIFSVFTARTSAFMGTRLECYIIARNKKSGLISWIIADYITNTNSHDPKKGFCGYNSEKAVFTTSPYKELIVDMKEKDTERRFTLTTRVEEGDMEELDEGLWVEGNMSVDYGAALKDEKSRPFSLIFDPVLMQEAREIPLENIRLEYNSFMNEIIDASSPECAALFPYSQHFIIKQDLQESVTGKDDLYKQIKDFMDLKGFKTMEGDDIKKPLFRSLIISSVLNLGLIIFLIIKAFF